MTQQRQTVGGRLRAVGRCAFVGTLVGMLVTQAVAEGPDAQNSQAPVKAGPVAVPSGSQAEQISFVLPANLPLAVQESASVDLSALPEAPATATGTSDSASVTMPPELKAMMEDAARNAQNVQPPPPKKSHGIQRPGMLILGIVGIPVAMLGIGLLQIDAGRNVGLKDGLGASFLGGGAAMAGFGFYFAFKSK